MTRLVCLICLFFTYYSHTAITLWRIRARNTVNLCPIKYFDLILTFLKVYSSSSQLLVFLEHFKTLTLPLQKLVTSKLSLNNK